MTVLAALPLPLVLHCLDGGDILPLSTALARASCKAAAVGHRARCSCLIYGVTYILPIESAGHSGTVTGARA